MYSRGYKYKYDIEVKVECEHCDNNFTRHDVLETNYRETKKSLEEMYENNYEGLSDEEMIHCEKCQGYMFETEVLEFTETKLGKDVENIEM